MRALVQDQAVGVGLAAELDAEEIGDLALVPAQERADRGDARDGPARDAPPHEKIFPLAAASEIAQFQFARRSGARRRPSACGRRR